MAKTLDELVTDTLGTQVLMILRLQAENGALTEKVAALETYAKVAKELVDAKSPALKLDANPNVPISEAGHVEFIAPEGGT